MTQKTIATLFIDKDSWLHRLHPFSKLTYILLMAIAVYTGPSELQYICLLVLLNIFIVTSAGMLKQECFALIKILLPLSLFMITIHGFLNPHNKTVLFDLHGITIFQEGLLYAINTLVKLTVVLMVSLLFVFSTHPADLITAISSSGNSPSLAYLLGSPLLLLGSMRERINTIQAAQQARGLHTKGNIIRRFSSLAPLVVPLIVGSIVEIEQRSIALEVRGFKSTTTKTTLRKITDSAVQRLARLLMLIASTFLLLFHLIL